MSLVCEVAGGSRGWLLLTMSCSKGYFCDAVNNVFTPRGIGTTATYYALSVTLLCARVGSITQSIGSPPEFRLEATWHPLELSAENAQLSPSEK